MVRVPEAPIGGFNRARGSSVGQSINSRRGDPGAAYEQAAAAAQDFIRVNVERSDQLRAVDAERTFRAQSESRIAGLDRTAPDYMDQVNRIFEEEGESARSGAGLVSTAAADRLNMGLAEYSAGGHILAAREQREALGILGKKQFDAMSLEAQAKIRDDPDGFDAYEDEFRAAAAQSLEAVDPLERSVLEDEHWRGNITALAAGYAAAGEFEKAKGIIDEHAGKFTTAQVEALHDDVDQAARQAAAERQAQWSRSFADVQIMAIDAQDVRTLNSARAIVADMDARGAFEGQEEMRVSLIRSIESQKAGLISKQAATNVSLDWFNAGLGVENQKQADLVYEEVLKTIPEDATEEQKQSIIAAQVSRMGLYPSKISGFIRNGERMAGSNPSYAANAAAFRDRMRAIAPDADDKLGETPTLDLISEYRSAMNVSYEEATKAVLDQRVDKAGMKAREEEFNTLVKDYDYTADIASALRTDVQNLADKIPFVNPGVRPEDIPSRVVEDYKANLKVLHKLSGDFETAKNAAKKFIPRTVGVSTFGGAAGPKPMKYPPERFINSTIMSTEQKAGAIDADVMDRLSAIGVPLPPSQEGQRPYILVEDEETDANVRAGDTPSYTVSTLQEIDGFFYYAPVRVVTKEGKEKQIRWSPPAPDQLKISAEKSADAELRKSVERSAEAKKQIEDINNDLATSLTGANVMSPLDALRDTLITE